MVSGWKEFETGIFSQLFVSFFIDGGGNVGGWECE